MHRGGNGRKREVQSEWSDNFFHMTFIVRVGCSLPQKVIFLGKQEWIKGGEDPSAIPVWRPPLVAG